MCPFKRCDTCLIFTCQKYKMEAREKLETQRVKCSSLHSALILRKQPANGRGRAQEIPWDFQAHWHKLHRRTITPSREITASINRSQACLPVTLCAIEPGRLDLKKTLRLTWIRSRAGTHVHTHTYTCVHLYSPSHCWLCHLPVCLYQKNETLFRQKSDLQFNCSPLCSAGYF